MVTILVSCGGASGPMVNACLSSLAQYNNLTKTVVRLVAPRCQQNQVTYQLSPGVEFRTYDVPDMGMSGSATHAAVLDKAVAEVDTEMFLTLDADCFPVNHCWLDILVEMLETDCRVAGILHPYAPPSDEFKYGGIELRIRSSLCWLNTHVACQLLKLDTFKSLGVKFSDGDDTGLAIPMAARKAGWKVGGYMPTRCPYPHMYFSDDPEMNRTECVIFGDMVYHHGGGTRESLDRGMPSGAYADTRKRVLEEGDASFILSQPNHLYAFAYEEDVADNMARGLMAGMVTYLQTHSGGLFKS